jgi:hypothetical protein
MALLLRADGTMEFVAPKGGRAEFALDELQGFVGGYIEHVGHPDADLHLWVNEEGKNNGLPPNRVATVIFRCWFYPDGAVPAIEQDWIAGDALLTTDAEGGS